MDKWKPTTGKSVTITLNASIHYTNGGINFKEGEKIKLAKHLWQRTQTTKNRRVVFRMLKKEYQPFTTIDKVTHGDCETTLTVKPFKF